MRPATAERLLDASIGAVLGAAAGDSMGSYLEFYKGSDYNNAVLESLGMPGGGHFDLAAGQVTDDMELGTSLAKGIRDFIALGENSLAALGSHIATNYVHWLSSGPFDVGNATHAAFFGSYKFMTPNDAVGAMRSRVNASNRSSRSNGFLMRISPMAVWLSGVIHEMIGKNMISMTKHGNVQCTSELLSILGAMSSVVSIDTQLTHCDFLVHICSSVYTVILASLIATEPDVKFAISMGHAMLECFKTERAISYAMKVGRWLEKGESLIYSNFKDKIGYVKHAFIGSIASLTRGGSPEDIIEDILHRFGDTDTNACIVMSCVGAVNGASKLPKLWKDKLATSNPLRRREEYRPDQLVSLALFIHHHSLTIERLLDLTAGNK